MIDTTSSFNIQISLEPVRNMIYSLLLIEKSNNLSGINHWPIDTYNAMTLEEKETHSLIFNGLYYAIMPKQSWTTFPGYIEHLASVPSQQLVLNLLSSYLDYPSPLKQEVDTETILASEDSYINFLNTIIDSQGNACCIIDETLERRAYKLLIRPELLQKTVVKHLTMLWDKYLAAEWISVKSIALDSVNSFNQMEFPNMDIHDVIKQITDKDSRIIFKKYTLNRIESVKRFIFVPSPHVGPYIHKLIQGESMWVFFGAKLPTGSKFDAPALDHQEIVTKLTAIADTKRLAVLKHIATVGERNSSQIINDLNLSQSAASRHLKQLSATGLLKENRKQDGKYYQINRDKIDSIFKSVIHYLRPDS